jgi:AraC-like DNA-binding protein
MSQERQTGSFDPVGTDNSEVTTLSRDYTAGYVIAPHFHNRDQLVYACRGVMTVRASDSAWVVPTDRAVWIPATLTHTITMSGTVSMRTLYRRPRLAKALPRSCCVVNVSPLLKELILHACTLTTLTKKIGQQRHLIDLVVDQLKTIQTVSLQLPNPSDSRALRVADVLLSDPGDQSTLTQICKGIGASKRTIERLFQEETGMTFGKWRQQLRLMHAMRLLADGAKVTLAAVEAGYSTPSAFISMFRKAWGTTPTRCFAPGPLSNSGMRVSLGGDKNYDTQEFARELRGMNITPHVAQNNTKRRSAVAMAAKLTR